MPPPDKLFFFIRIFLPYLSPSPDFCPALRLHFPNLLDVSIWMSCCHLKLDLTKSHLFSSTSVIIVTPVTQAGNPTASVNVFFSLAAINGSPNPVAWNLLRLSQPRGFLFPLVLPFPGPDPLVVLSRLLSRMALPADLTQSNPFCTHSCQTSHSKMLFFQATVILKFLQRLPTTCGTGAFPV